MMTQQKRQHRSLVWLDWPAPKPVKACYSLRLGGVSHTPYDSFNLAFHVDDQHEHVLANRRQLANIIGQDNIYWLKQVHSNEVIDLGKPHSYIADASFTRQKNVVCCVLTADCLPVFFCDRQGSQVAIAHAGWRGVLRGVIQATLATFDEPTEVIAYLGPAISQRAFEVGDDVRDAFMNEPSLPNNVREHFVPGRRAHKWMADLYGVARTLLRLGGVSEIYGGDCCTYGEAENFFSYRRDAVTGRMAHLIWLDSPG